MTDSKSDPRSTRGVRDSPRATLTLMLLALADRFTHYVFDKRSGPAVFAIRTAAVGYAVVLLCTLPILFSNDPNPNKIAADDSLSYAISALIFAPLVENFVMICMTSLLSGLKLRTFWTVALVGAAFAWLHSFGARPQVVPGLLMFAMMSYSYLIWAERPFRNRYLITIGQHVLFNLPGTLILIVYSRLS